MDVARVRVEALGLAGELDARDRPAAALEDGALEREQQRRGERRGAQDDLLALLDLEAVAGEQVGEAVGVERGHGASTSGKCSVRCSRRTARIHARSSVVETRNRISSSFCLVIGSTPAIVQLTARRSNRNSTARCHASSRDSGLPPRTSAYFARVAGV